MAQAQVVLLSTSLMIISTCKRHFATYLEGMEEPVGQYDSKCRGSTMREQNGDQCIRYSTKLSSKVFPNSTEMKITRTNMVIDESYVTATSSR